MNYLDAEIAIALAAKENGMTTEELKEEIDLAIDEAMQSWNPLTREFWAHIPKDGDKPTAVEFIAFMREMVHRKDHNVVENNSQPKFPC